LAEKEPSGSGQRIAALPGWVRLAILLALVAVAVLLSKWLILILLIAIGLWPITLLLGLVALVVLSIWKGGWPWMKSWLGARLAGLAVPVLAVVTALIVGAVIIMLTDQAAYKALGEGQAGEAIKLAFTDMAKAYRALYEGALGSPADIVQTLGQWLHGEELKPLLSALRGPSDSLVQSVPYIFAGLAVALGFRAGLFNIGAEGQIGVGCGGRWLFLYWPARLAPPTPGHRGRGGSGRALGGDRRLSQSPDRRPRGDHDHHA
jgi:hypothetical protein